VTKIAVTGATGFIGQAVCRALVADGNDVVAIGRNTVVLDNLAAHGSQVHACDLSQDAVQALPFEGCDVLIHLADQADRNAVLAGSSTAIATNVSKAVVTSGIKKIVQTSSVYASLAERGVIQTYGSEKLLAEDILSSVPGVDNVILRLPPVYGAGGKGSIATLAKLISRGIPVPFRAANAPRDYISITNLVGLIQSLTQIDLQLFSKVAQRPIEPSDGRSVSTKELSILIGQALGTPTKFLPLPKLLLEMAANMVGKAEIVAAAFAPLQVNSDSRILDLIGWQPAETMPDSLAYLRAVNAAR
jgi:nucleoside-diphosphate-sugar epimerase